MNSSSAEVRVRMKYLVTLKEQTGIEDEQIVLPADATLENVADWLKQRYGVSASDPQVMATLNGKGWDQYPAKLATELNDGDLVVLFPMLSGG